MLTSGKQSGRGQYKGMSDLERRAEYQEKCRQALRMKIDGHTAEEIALALKWADISSVYEAIKRGTTDIPKAEATEYREIHLQRLEGLWRFLLPGMKVGDPKSVEQGVNVLKREAALLGLDAPVRVDIRRIVDEYAQEYDLTAEESALLFQRIKDHMAATPTPAPERG